ncbi:ATP-binding protein [Streptomyces apocyni]|uniref:ATP-binding protein n=1 Tax=Streptomyces apocyni TaxID=2654677 RepID=UPI0012EA85F6|nr:ATP-binding protein [Streptomyces apocyni]
MVLGNAPLTRRPSGAVTLDRRCRFELAARPDSVPRARRLTRDQLTGWSLPDETCDMAALVVSELVTNAVVHTASRLIVCELREDTAADTVRIVVRDEGPGPGVPAPHPARDGHEDHGRGLLLVDAVSSAWGTAEADEGLGLVVWAELPREAGPLCA